MVLPLHVESERPTFAGSPSLTQYMRRMVHWAQMDVDYTYAQMLSLCLAPRTVYQLTSYRKQTKNQWARDDPAFVVLLVFFLAVAAVSYSVALQSRGAGILRLLLLFVGVHFVFTGTLIATLSWFISNRFLRVQSFHGVEQRMEWMYAFDIHCNAFFPLFVVLYVVHYFLLPVLVKPSTGTLILGNVLYAVALCYYFYVTWLGYTTLPFLERTEVFLYPGVVVACVLMVITILKINLIQASLGTYTL